MGVGVPFTIIHPGGLSQKPGTWLEAISTPPCLTHRPSPVGRRTLAHLAAVARAKEERPVLIMVPERVWR